LQSRAFADTNLAWVDLGGAEGVVVGTHLDGKRCEACGCEVDCGMSKSSFNCRGCAWN
jgi:hypothetical protein